MGAFPLLGRAFGPTPVPALAWAALTLPVVCAWWGRPAAFLATLPTVGWLALGEAPRPFLAAAALWSLALLGATAGSTAKDAGDRARIALGLLVLFSTLTAAPLLAGDEASPRTLARLHDLSPVTLVAEAAGHDWLRDPAVYDRAGGDRIGPELRTPHGRLAAGVPALLGFALLLARRLLSSRRSS